MSGTARPAAKWHIVMQLDGSRPLHHSRTFGNVPLVQVGAADVTMQNESGASIARRRFVINVKDRVSLCEFRPAGSLVH